MVYAANQQSGGGFSVLIMMALIFAAFYFLMFRPQQRRRRDVDTMQASLGAGDEIITVGGLHGTVRTIDDDTVLVEIAPEVVVRFARAAIGKIITSAADAADSPEDGQGQTLLGGGDDLSSTEKKIINPD